MRRGGQRGGGRETAVGACRRRGRMAGKARRVADVACGVVPTVEGSSLVTEHVPAR